MQLQKTCILFLAGSQVLLMTMMIMRQACMYSLHQSSVYLKILCFDQVMYFFFLCRYDVRLMTEGRMKGQAFVTLPSTKLAQQALEETNGYILKDKPLVVQFARSAPASVGTQSTS